MKFLTLAALLSIAGAAAPLAAYADDQAACTAASGVFMTGTVHTDPVFQAGAYAIGKVEISHTHLTIQSDSDHVFYDVAMDNVFASGYDTAGEAIPTPLTSIQKGDRLEVCGKLYTSGGTGIHWVHSDCGGPATPANPDGWVKIIDTNGTVGPNLEDSQKYCSIWPH